LFRFIFHGARPCFGYFFDLDLAQAGYFRGLVHILLQEIVPRLVVTLPLRLALEVLSLVEVSRLWRRYNRFGCGWLRGCRLRHIVVIHVYVLDGDVLDDRIATIGATRLLDRLVAGGGRGGPRIRGWLWLPLDLRLPELLVLQEVDCVASR
jgi:hypothetical protein